MSFWPYEELQVTKLAEPGTFRFETPWYASVVTTDADGERLFEKAFFHEAGAELPPAELLSLYARLFAPLMHEPFAYILPAPGDSALAAEGQGLAEDVFQTPKTFAKAFDLPADFFPEEWSWDADAILAMSACAEGAHSPLSLFSAFRRFFYLEAMEHDRTRSLYRDLPSIAGPSHMAPALAFVISQNLHVTQRCAAVLGAAEPQAGNALEALREFAKAERGHDRIMAGALAAFPSPLPPWSLEVHPATGLLMDLFHQLARFNFLAFAFAVHLFERPQFEDVHPVTKLLREHGLDKAADRYEVHHRINDDGDHDHIGFDLIRVLPPLSSVAARQAVRWAEAMSRVMSLHSAALLSTIEERASLSHRPGSGGLES